MGRGLQHDSLEALQARLASWQSATGPWWILEAAPRIIAELQAEIRERTTEEQAQASEDASTRS